MSGVLIKERSSRFKTQIHWRRQSEEEGRDYRDILTSQGTQKVERGVEQITLQNFQKEPTGYHFDLRLLVSLTIKQPPIHISKFVGASLGNKITISAYLLLTREQMS